MIEEHLHIIAGYVISHCPQPSHYFQRRRQLAYAVLHSSRPTITVSVDPAGKTARRRLCIRENRHSLIPINGVWR